MPRCPNCNSTDVYRHTRLFKGSRYLCRDCMTDLVLAGGGTFSLKSLIIVFVGGMEFLLLMAFRWPLIPTVIGGIIALIPLFQIASSYAPDLEAIPRDRQPLSSGSPGAARTAWAGLRRRNQPPTA